MSEVAVVPRILVVDDDSVDVRVLIRSLKKCGIDNPITTACDGSSALKVLRGDSSNEPLQRPYIVLLDINMPRMNGIEFLEELRKDPALHDTIVFVLTTSDNERDIVAAYQSHVAGYLVKGGNAEELRRLVQMIGGFLQSVCFNHKIGLSS